MVLTRREDSLPALSGLAACMEHLEPGEYIAGLWEHDIALQLGWRVGPSSGQRRWEVRPYDSEIFGPTFSWSSHAYPVLPESRPDTQSICALVSCDVTLVPPTTNPYGQVKQASISLRGRVMRGRDMLQWFEVLSFQERDHQGRANVYLDSAFHFEPLDRENVFCFGLYEYGGSEQRARVDALLLQRENFHYVRIGVYWKLDRFWFNENAVERTITII